MLCDARCSEEYFELLRYIFEELFLLIFYYCNSKGLLPFPKILNNL